MTNYMRKIKNGFRVIREQGLVDFAILLLTKVKNRDSKLTVAQKSKIHTKARYKDILSFKGKPIELGEQVVSGQNLKIAWIMPPPGKGSGGHINIFRFIEYLEKAGHKSTIYIYVDSEPISIQAIKDSMGDSYPRVDALNQMKWLAAEETNLDEGFDAIIATSWETAYASFSLDSRVKRFYFVQDFEPYFYPMGGMYTLAENTYRMGFHGITAGGWLDKKLTEEYGMECSHYNFSADKKLYPYINSATRTEIFCYVRPYTERRGFEVAILALDLFHKKHPEVVINLAGWDVSAYDIPFPYNNLNVLEVSQLSELYNKCAAALVLSYTNMSLLPLELLSCGCIPIVNKADNNTLVSSNKYIQYANSNPSDISEELSAVVSMNNLQDYSLEASKSVGDNGWDRSGELVVRAIESKLLKK